ncbi:MAG: DUF4830 domain-containing protein [Candidatus Omnitrophica bacterium]|jgi:hypothetical protein|nr:DUF4830 domain-containing protein [Candidatus Omnitrophota bacterium]
MKKKIIIIIAAAILVFMGREYLFAADSDIILEKLKKLNIEVAGPAEQREEQLPEEFTGPYWGLLSNICRDSGWDLAAYAGKKVLSTSFPIQEKFGDDSLNVWVIDSGRRTACVYKTVREGSELVPGIFPVENTLKKRN